MARLDRAIGNIIMYGEMARSSRAMTNREQQSRLLAVSMIRWSGTRNRYFVINQEQDPADWAGERASCQRFVHGLPPKRKSRRESPRRPIIRRYEMTTSLILLLLIVVVLGFEVKIRINRR